MYDFSKWGQQQNAMLRAIESERGIRLAFSSSSDATLFRNACHKFRAAQRKVSEFQTSPYDDLKLSIVEESGKIILNITKRQAPEISDL